MYRAAILAAVFAAGSAYAELQTVFDTGRTVDATQYYAGKVKADRVRNPPSVATDFSDQARLPIQSERLRPGPATVLEVDGLLSPFFIMGMDVDSLRWFFLNAVTLQDMGASGVVVEAWHLQDWQELKAWAAQRGIVLSLLDGDPLASLYSITTYPTVMVQKEATQ